MFDYFKTRVIDASESEISTHTDLIIENVHYGKIGRKIKDSFFTVQIQSESVYLETQSKSKISTLCPIIDQLISLGFAVETVKKYKAKYGVKRIERNIAYALAKKQAGLVKDLLAYLNLATTEDMGGLWEVSKVQQAHDKQQEQLCLAALETQAEKAHAAVIQRL